MVKAILLFFISPGLNLARMFGDKFLKEQDSRFSSEPYVSQAVHITKACTAFAVIAR
jgi:protein phosphatase